jgi:D-psicose/D-tagatose/L-ribulose 3-epimerase
MRIGASAWAWTFPFDGTRDIRLVDHLADLGADHFEIGGEVADAPRTLDTRALRERLEARGMTASVCGLFSDRRDLSSDDPDVRAAGLAHLRDCIDVAAEIGAKTVVGAVCGVGGKDLVTAEERTRRNALAAGELAAAAESAASAGIRIGVEALNRYENNFLNAIAQSKPIVDAVDHPNLGYHLDLFHAYIEEPDLTAAILVAADKLFHCHAVDSNRLAPGAGHAPWPVIADALQAIDYQGALVIETFDPDNPILAPLAGFWRPLPRPQDDLIRDGVAFLRRHVARAEVGSVSD